MTVLADLLDDEEMSSTLPEATGPMFKLMADLDKPIAVLTKERMAEIAYSRSSE